MRGYGWTAYDTRVGGSQTIRDAELHIDLTTDFVKSDDGNSWALRVTGVPRKDAPSGLKTTVILHSAVEEAGSDDARTLACEHTSKRRRNGDDSSIECHGEVSGLGSFELSLMGDGQNNPVHDTAVNSVRVPESKIWQAKGMYFSPPRLRPRSL